MKLNFDKTGLLSVNFFVEKLSFPVAMAAYSEWDMTQIQYLQNVVKEGKFNTESLCKWCIIHHIQFSINYSVSINGLIKNPRKALAYLHLLIKLRKSCF